MFSNQYPFFLNLKIPRNFIRPFSAYSYRCILLLVALMILASCSTKNSQPVEIVKESPTEIVSTPYAHQPIVVMRSSSSELQLLARLASAIEELEALIREAEASADPDARIRFDYYQLRADILSISQGIQAHIRTPVYTPRTLKPIAGNYGR